MATLGEVRKQGWYLTEEGFKKCVDGCTELGQAPTLQNLIGRALNTDLRAIGDKVFPEAITRGGVKELSGHNMVLQIQKVRNVAVVSKKQNDDSSQKRLLRLQLTDGKLHCAAIEMNSIISGLKPSTYPGTKVLLTAPVQIVGGFMLLGGNNARVLGGEVDHMIKKWDLPNEGEGGLDRRKVGDGGPPLFAPFTTATRKPPDTPTSAKHRDTKTHPPGKANDYKPRTDTPAQEHKPKSELLATAKEFKPREAYTKENYRGRGDRSRDTPERKPHDPRNQHTFGDREIRDRHHHGSDVRGKDDRDKDGASAGRKEIASRQHDGKEGERPDRRGERGKKYDIVGTRQEQSPTPHNKHKRRDYHDDTGHHQGHSRYDRQPRGGPHRYHNNEDYYDRGCYDDYDQPRPTKPLQHDDLRHRISSSQSWSRKEPVIIHEHWSQYNSSAADRHKTDRNRTTEEIRHVSGKMAESLHITDDSRTKSSDRRKETSTNITPRPTAAPFSAVPVPKT